MYNYVEVSDDRFSKVEERLKKMKNRAEEFCQTRSYFQMEKFLAGDEYTPISKFRHVAHNSYITMQEVRREMITKERLERKIKRLEIALRFNIPVEEIKDLRGPFTQNGTNPHFNDYDLDMFELSRQLEAIEIRIKGLLKEVDFMEKICDELEKEEIEKTGTGFTDEKFQAQEPEYWEKRLLSQAHYEQGGRQLGMSEGNYKSILKASETPILPGSMNEISTVNLSPNEVAVRSLISRPGLKEKFLTEVNPEDQKQIKS